MQNKNPMLQLSTIHDFLPPTFMNYMYNLFRIMLLFSFFMFCGNQLILCHHTHLSSFTHIKILNNNKDFHFLPWYYKKRKEGRKDTLPKHVVTQQWKFPFQKFFFTINIIFPFLLNQRFYGK